MLMTFVQFSILLIVKLEKNCIYVKIIHEKADNFFKEKHNEVKKAFASL